MYTYSYRSLPHTSRQQFANAHTHTLSFSISLSLSLSLSLYHYSKMCIYACVCIYLNILLAQNVCRPYCISLGHPGILYVCDQNFNMQLSLF